MASFSERLVGTWKVDGSMVTWYKMVFLTAALIDVHFEKNKVCKDVKSRLVFMTQVIRFQI